MSNMDSNFVNKLVGPKGVSSFELDMAQLLMSKSHDPVLSGERTKMTLAQQLNVMISSWRIVRDVYSFDEFNAIKVQYYYEALNSTKDEKEIDEFLSDHWVKWIMEGLLP